MTVVLPTLSKVTAHVRELDRHHLPIVIRRRPDGWHVSVCWPETTIGGAPPTAPTAYAFEPELDPLDDLDTDTLSRPAQPPARRSQTPTGRGGRTSAPTVGGH